MCIDRKAQPNDILFGSSMRKQNVVQTVVETLLRPNKNDNETKLNENFHLKINFSLPIQFGGG